MVHATGNPQPRTDKQRIDKILEFVSDATLSKYRRKILLMPMVTEHTVTFAEAESIIFRLASDEDQLGTYKPRSSPPVAPSPEPQVTQRGARVALTRRDEGKAEVFLTQWQERAKGKINTERYYIKENGVWLWPAQGAKATCSNCGDYHYIHWWCDLNKKDCTHSEAPPEMVADLQALGPNERLPQLPPFRQGCLPGSQLSPAKRVIPTEELDKSEYPLNAPASKASVNISMGTTQMELEDNDIYPKVNPIQPTPEVSVHALAATRRLAQKKVVGFNVNSYPMGMNNPIVP